MNLPFFRRLLLLAIFSVCAMAPVRAAEGKAKPPRAFRFTYSATVVDLKPGQTARVWLPVPPRNDDQDVEIASKDLPAVGRIGTERTHGNRILYFEAKADDKGCIPFSVVYRVKRRELTRDRWTKGNEKAEELTRLVQANRRVPITGKPLELLKDKQVPSDEMETARLIYDVVNSHMRYSKEGAGWGEGDAVWACENGRGNCTDFHSLFMSLARSRHIPAKFEIGFSLPIKHGSGDIAGYHCWAKFRLSSGVWVPVDISEANKEPRLRDYYFGNLSADRVSFSTGRDLTLEPPQAGPPLNFFIYPYVEVEGKEYPQAKIERHMSFRDEQEK
jgi:transglutaminase-like putative cysteine protease